MFPVSSFLILALGALLISNRYFEDYKKIQKRNLARQQKFDQFVENIKSGKWQLTNDKWIEEMKLQGKVSNDQFESIVPLIEFLQFIGWFSLVLAVCNVLAVLYVKDKIKKRQNDLICEEQKK